MNPPKLVATRLVTVFQANLGNSGHVCHILSILAVLLEHAEVVSAVVAWLELLGLLSSTLLLLLLTAGEVRVELAVLYVQRLRLPSAPACPRRGMRHVGRARL